MGFSAHMYLLYKNDLSFRLNAVQAGCFVGNKRINHLMYADDFCCFAPRFSKYMQNRTVLC